MSAEPVNDWKVRHPWPDEIDRTLALLDTPTFTHSPWIWVCATGTPERLVGAAALDPVAPAGRGARLHLSVRPRFRDTPAATALATSALSKALQEGALPVVARVASDNGLRPRLEQAGLSFVQRECFWEVGVDRLQARLGSFATRGGQRIDRAKQVRISPPEAGQIRQIVCLLQDRGLWEGGELVFAPEQGASASEPSATPPAPIGPAQGEGFSRTLSVVVSLQGVVAAVMLVRQVGRRRLLVPYRAVASNFLPHSITFNLALMLQGVLAAAEAGFRQMVFVSHGGVRDDTARLATRSGGRCLRSIEVHCASGGLAAAVPGRVEGSG